MMIEPSLIIFVCSNCGHQKQVKDSYLGKLANCPECNESSIVGEVVKPAEPPAIPVEKTEPATPTAKQNKHLATEDEITLYWINIGRFIAIPIGIIFFLNILWNALSFWIVADNSDAPDIYSRNSLSELAHNSLGILVCITCLAILYVAKKKIHTDD